jgi:hypothetical protein
MPDSTITLILCALTSLVVLAPYVVGVRPRSRREWQWIVLTLAFLFWMLGGFRGLRS